MEQDIVVIKNLSKEFKGQKVLREVSMKIPEHCVYGLLGPNGAGKSTLLKTITGLLKPTSGAVFFQGHRWLLVLDEPINGLDPLVIQQLRELIRSFPKKGITVILSSHILSEIQQTADYIGIISGGRLGFEGKVDEQEDLEALFMEVTAKGRTDR